MATIISKNEVTKVLETYQAIKEKINNGHKFIELTIVYDSGFPNDKEKKYKILYNTNKILFVR